MKYKNMLIFYIDLMVKQLSELSCLLMLHDFVFIKYSINPSSLNAPIPLLIACAIA